jgi:hypothetical protein
MTAPPPAADPATSPSPAPVDDAARPKPQSEDDAEPHEPAAGDDARMQALERRLEAVEQREVEASNEADRQARLEALEAENAAMREQIEQLRTDQQFERERVDQLAPVAARFHGYVDFGFFAVTGDGSGIRPDLGNRRFPELDAIPGAWVFMGDPLSTAINNRGEPADTGASRALTFDAVGARDRPTFILNALNFGPSATLAERVVVTGLVDFMPRTRDMSDPDGRALGDYVDVKRADVRWIVPVRRFDLDLFAGKIDSVVGYEYRVQESPQRLTVTPSWLCRYTCERAMGVAARFGFLERMLRMNLAVTNGSNVRELFGLHDEVDANAFKTVSGRFVFALPWVRDLELGVSGAFGAQDLQRYDNVFQWQYGADAHLYWKNLEATAEFQTVRAQGRTTAGGIACDASACLQSMGAYGLVAYRVLPWLVPFFRADWRDATHRRGTDFAYITDGVRLNPGVNLPVSPHVVVKAEYSVNLEIGEIPQFPNDVFTSALVGYF